MAFSFYHNGSIPEGFGRVEGIFRHSESDCAFEFATIEKFTPFCKTCFPHIVFVGPEGDIRYAKVGKTVVHIVIDEDEFGEPVVEKWSIKQFRSY